MLKVQIAFVAAFIGWQYLKPLSDVLFGASSTVYVGSACGLAAFALALIRSKLHLSKYIQSMLIWAVFMTTVGAMSALSGGGGVVEVWALAFQAFSIVAISVAAEDVAAHYGPLRWLVRVSVCLAVVSAMIGIWGAVTGKALLNVSRDVVGVGELGFDVTTGRSGGLRGENYVGLWLAPATALAVITISSGHLVWPSVLLLLSLSGVAASLSRTAIVSTLASIAGGVVWLLAQRRIKSVAIVVITVLFVGSAAAVVILRYGEWRNEYMVSKNLVGRFTSPENLLGRRELMWERGLADFLASPVLGSGFGSRSKGTLGIAQYHNSILDIACELGVFGLFVFLYPWWRAARVCRAARRWWSRSSEFGVLALSLLAMVVSLMSLSNPFLKIAWVFLALLHGCARGLSSANQGCPEQVARGRPGESVFVGHNGLGNALICDKTMDLTRRI